MRVPMTYPAATQSVAVDARRPLTLTAASAVLTAFPPLAPDAANPLHALPAPPRALDVDSIVGGARRHARADAVADADARDVDRAVANDADRARGSLANCECPARRDGRAGEVFGREPGFVQGVGLRERLVSGG